jgi:hypothetical protein
MEEKSKKWAIVVVGLLLIGVIASAGCIGDKTTEEGEEAPAGEGTTPTTQTPTATSVDEGTSLSELLGKAESHAVKIGLDFFSISKPPPYPPLRLV